jgi:hypothetical protein
MAVPRVSDIMVTACALLMGAPGTWKAWLATILMAMPKIAVKA